MIEADIVDRLVGVLVFVADLRPCFGGEVEGHDVLWDLAARAGPPRANAAGDAGREAADSIVENGPLVAEERYAVKDFVQGIGSFNSTRFW